ncbi:MAG TPA: calcium-binding protein, partial [Solirubrobacterales bacterium]
SGTCAPNTDPLTGRPTFNECLVTNEVHTLAPDLRAGDDTVEIDARSSVINLVQLSAGAGNDAVTVVANGQERRLAGDDGNDLLIAAGGISSTPSSNRAAVFDGGAGTDTAGWFAPQFGFPAESLGVTASLATGTGTFASGGTALRTDVLQSIEGLSGTEVGDVLTGSTGANTLSGNGGNDNLSGGDGADNLLGGEGLDDLVGGKDADTLDGGIGIDTYPVGAGGDTFLTRDGYAETVPCFSNDVIADDLVDRVSGTPSNCSISTAAAKHRYDTKLSGQPAKIENGALATRVRCPALKTETCEGKLEALFGRRELGHTAYKVRPGNKADVLLPISKANARRVEGKKILLSASEVDADKRDRFVSRPIRVAKTAGGGSLSRPR